MKFAELKSSMLLTLLSVFAVGWITLYWIMESRVTAAEATALEMHGQQKTSIDEVNQGLRDMGEMLGRIDERTKHQSETLNSLQKDIQKLTAVLLKPQTQAGSDM